MNNIPKKIYKFGIIFSVLLIFISTVVILIGCIKSAFHSHYRSLPNELYKKTEHFIPIGKADEYWLDDVGLDGFIIRKYKLVNEDISKLEIEIYDHDSKWKPFEGEHVNMFENKYGKKIYFDEDTEDVFFREGTYYYCTCDAGDYSYFNILEDTFLIHPSWFFIYDVDNEMYYAILC